MTKLNLFFKLKPDSIWKTQESGVNVRKFLSNLIFKSMKYKKTSAHTQNTLQLKNISLAHAIYGIWKIYPCLLFCGCNLEMHAVYKTNWSLLKYISFDSSVGRAEDCSWIEADILRSLVRIRFEGEFLSIYLWFWLVWQKQFDLTSIQSEMTIS